MPDIKRTVRVKTHQEINGKGLSDEGFPQRSWSVELYLVNENGGADVEARVYDEAKYKLHASFPKERQEQRFSAPPFRCEEEGWGEFEMNIELSFKGGKHVLPHLLHFGEDNYVDLKPVSFKNPKPEVAAMLAASGPLPAGVSGAPGTAAGSSTPGGPNGATPISKKKSRKSNNVDMEKLAEGLQRLTEDDLLHVVHMIHEEKTPETYTKNDVENGEFHVDLYTLPDGLVKSLWDYCGERGAA